MVCEAYKLVTCLWEKYLVSAVDIEIFLLFQNFPPAEQVRVAEFVKLRCLTLKKWMENSVHNYSIIIIIFDI